MKTISPIIISLLFLSCAQFVPPTGGKRDITPPKLLKSSPTTKTINFKEKTITLEFDEYIDINSLKQELIVIPQPKSSYNVKQKDKTVKLTYEEHLDSNTTYTFNFRNGIKDLNEQNPTKNLKIVLSTGNNIDSLNIQGKVIDIHTKTPVLDALVGLYNITDTIKILKRKPDYFIKTDSSGKYVFENIKANNYIILAFTDKNQNLIYDQKSETFAFKKDTINLNKNIVLDSLELYKANYTPNKIKRAISRENTFVAQLDKKIKDAKIIINSPNIDYNYTTESVTFYKLAKTDTALATIILVDSLLNADTLSQKIYFQEPSKTSKKTPIQPFSIESSIKNNESIIQDLVYNLKFEYPITRFDSNKVIFKTDTLQTEKLNYKWKNTSELQIKIKTKAKNQIELIIPSNSFQNYKNDTNSKFILKNKILKSDELGMIEGKTSETKGTKIALLLNAENLEIKYEQTFTDKFSFKNIKPDTYIIKIIFDSNKNGIWDPGKYSIGKYPEKIIIYKTAIKVRANFEIKDIKIE